MDKTQKGDLFVIFAAFLFVWVIAAIWAVFSPMPASLAKLENRTCHSITEDSTPYDCNFTRIGPIGAWTPK